MTMVHVRRLMAGALIGATTATLVAAQAPAPARASAQAARLTIDITPDLRGRIKVIAFRRGVTVADMLRELLKREFPDISGDAS